MVAYVTAGLSCEESQAVSRHLVFCDTCFSDFLALLGPEKTKKLLQGEQFFMTTWTKLGSSEQINEGFVDILWRSRLV
jgi:hypothetical protein